MYIAFKSLRNPVDVFGIQKPQTMVNDDWQINIYLKSTSCFFLLPIRGCGGGKVLQVWNEQVNANSVLQANQELIYTMSEINGSGMRCSYDVML